MGARGWWLAAALGGTLTVDTAPVASGAADDAYLKQIEQHRKDRETRLRGERGWLSLVGLYWLNEGANQLGSDQRADVLLPAGAPARAGTLSMRDGRVSVQVAAGVAATIDGKPVTAADLRPDDPGPPDVLMLGTVSLQVIKRAEKLGVRLKDSASPARRAFEGLRFFPIRPAYRVSARFVPHPRPVSITVPSAVGPAQTLESPGAAVFTLDGRELRLDAILEEPADTELFFVFRDATSGHDTYGGGRFLYTPLPRDGKVEMDFNKAFSPPCAFTPFATCPLPPPQNRLPVRIEAGELAPPVHP